MVMLTLSLRAVFKKESWIFCAGLSILPISFSGSHHDQTAIAPNESSGAQTRPATTGGFPTIRRRCGEFKGAGRRVDFALSGMGACAVRELHTSGAHRPGRRRS